MTDERNVFLAADGPADALNQNIFDLIEKAKTEWEATTDALRQLVLLLDGDGLVIRANRVIEQWVGGSVRAAKGKSIHDLIHPGCNQLICPLHDGWEEARKKLADGQSVRFSFPDPERSRFLSVELRPVASPRRYPQAVWSSFAVAVIEDISERMAAEEALRLSEEKFSKAFRHSPAAMCMASVDDGQFFEVNEEFERLLGYPRGEIIGKSSLELGIWDDPRDRKHVVDMLNGTGAARNLEFRFRRKNGGLLVCRYSAERVALEGQTCVLSTIIDLTERKWAEEALRREKAFSDAVLDSVPGLLYLFDEKGFLVGCNRRTEEITGYSAEELAKKHLLDWFEVEGGNRAAIEKALRQIFENGYAEAEAIIVTKDGSRLMLFCTGVRLVIDNRTFLVGIGTDITGRKRSEEELRRNRNMLANILNSVPLSIFWKDRDSVYRGCNEVFARRIGISTPEAIAGMTDSDLPWLPDNIETYRADDRDVISSIRPKRRFAELMRQADGSRIWVDVFKVPLTDETGSVTGILGIHEDITERVRSEGQIRQLATELKTIFQVLPDRFWKMDSNGTILGWDIGHDGGAADFAASACGKRIYEVFPPPVNETIQQAMEQALHDRSQVKINYELSVHGEVQIFEARILPLLENQVFVVSRNVTEQMRLEAIAQSVEMMNNFGYIFSGIRHEIGNPINSIKMTMSVLKSHIDRYSQAMILEYVDRVLSEIARVEYLLRSLKNFNMFESMKPRPVNVVAFMDDFLTLIRGDFGRQGIEIVSEVNPACGDVFCDPRALHQVLLNIVSNAADALREQDERWIVMRAARRKDRLEIVVKDNGCGMSTTQRANLFRPFFTSKSDGTGLGLVIVKKLLGQMDGSIEVETLEGRGTTVLINLPVEGRG
jgi:PAS domain S-box-containing protein